MKFEKLILILKNIDDWKYFEGSFWGDYDFYSPKYLIRCTLSSYPINFKQRNEKMRSCPADGVAPYCGLNGIFLKCADGQWRCLGANDQNLGIDSEDFLKIREDIEPIFQPFCQQRYSEMLRQEILDLELTQEAFDKIVELQ